MVCKVSLNINNRKMDKPVATYGAKIIPAESVTTLNESFNEEVTLPTKTKLNRLDAFNRGASYIFSNIKTTSTDDLKKLGVLDNPKAMQRLKSAGANLYKGLADSYFTKNPNKVLNPINNGNIQVIVEEDPDNRVLDSEKRGFIRITAADIADFRQQVRADVGVSLDETQTTYQQEEDLLNEGLEFLVISALYRGYNIVFDNTVNGDMIQSVFNRFNYLKGKDQKIQFVSPYRVGKNIVKTRDAASYVENIKARNVLRPKRVYSESAFLNTFLTKHERIVYTKHKKTNKAANRFITRKLAKVFSNTLKGVDVEVLSNEEVAEKYGHSFATKKGFIVGGQIVLNSDLMTPDTVFHEFGHFYMEWLKQHDSAAYRHILDKVLSENPGELEWYRKKYQATGLQFTEEDIEVEMFVDKLGLMAASQLQEAIENSDSTVAETVEDYAEAFLQNLVRNTTVNSKAVGFKMNTSISEMLDMAFHLTGRYQTNTMFTEEDKQNLHLFKDFVLPHPTSQDIFNSLISRGLVQSIGKDTIILTDPQGNRYNARGEVSYGAKYKFYNWDTPAHVKHNQIMLERMHGYLTRFENEATVMFSTQNPKIQSVVDKIKANTGGLQLTKDEKNYTKKINGQDVILRRTTSFLSDEFSNGDTEEFVLRKVWIDAVNTYKKTYATSKMSQQEIDTNAVAYAEKLFAEQGEDFRQLKYDVERIFAFKTEEGTALHALAEFYFMTLQFSNEIDFKTKREGGYMHFRGPIKDAMSSGDLNQFNQYITTHFINNLQHRNSDPEVKKYQELFDFVKKTLAGRNSLHVNRLIEMLDETVIENNLNKLPGPLTIMTEVQLQSKTLGVAGTIDLLVIDGFGKAHIFDYKTKAADKELWWDYNSSVKMRGVLDNYADNAMMKASIQTSVYKLILMEMGIETAPSNVFYIENDFLQDNWANPEDSNDPDGIFFEEKRFAYRPKRILKKGLQDVSGELAIHFEKNEGRELDFIDTEAKGSGVKDVIIKASGGRDIDIPGDTKKRAQLIYDRAVSFKNNDSNKKADEAIRRYFGKIPGVGGLTVVLPGNSRVKLEGGLTKDGYIAKIEEMLRDRRDIKNIEAEFISVFNAADREEAGVAKGFRESDRNQKYRGLLVDADSSTHEIEKWSSNVTYGNEASGILGLTNKTTKGTRIILLNHDRKQRIHFGEKDRYNIYGNYVSNNKAAMLDTRNPMRANNYNMRLIKLGIMLAQRKLNDPEFTVEVIMSNNDLSKFDTTVPMVYDINTILLSTKNMLTTMKNHGETLHPSVQALLDNPTVFEASKYQQNPVDVLTEFLNISTGSLVRTKDFFANRPKAKLNRENLQRLLNAKQGFENTQEILYALREFRHSLSQAKNQNLNAKLHDDLWTLTDQCIMFLNGFNYLIHPKNTTIYDNFLAVTTKTSNMYQSFYARKITEGKVNINDDFMNYKNEHNKLIQDIAESRGINIQWHGSALYSSSRKKIFNNLFEFENDGDNYKAFRLRNPNFPSKISRQGQTKLNAAEIAYLRFFRKQAQEFADMTAKGTKYDVPYGWMPLMKKSKMSNRHDLSVFDRAVQMKEDVTKAMTPSSHTQKNEYATEEAFVIESKFKGQFPKEGAIQDENYTSARRDWLGVDETGTVIDPEADLSLIEDNLENVLDNMAISSLEEYHYGNVTEFGKALFYNIKRHENLTGGTSYDAIVKTLALIQRRVIKHEKSDSGVVVKGINRLATMSVTAGTVHQALLETFTNPLVTASTYVSDKLYGTLFQGEREFSMSSFSTAFNMIWNPANTKHKEVIEALDNMYGITNMDTANLKEVLNQLESNSLFQSKHLMYINKIMLENWQKVTMVAYMLEQGSFYAHSIDDNGNLVYDESKDERFYSPRADVSEQVDKKARYLATKDELAKQRNGLTGTAADEYKDRKLRRAWTTYDVNHVKGLIVEAYSSMDDSSKSLATYYTITELLFKMRTWLFPKIPRYFQKPMSAEENSAASRLVKEDDPTSKLGYRYVWKGPDTEGILYTVQYLLRGLQEEKFNVFSKKAWKLKNEEQKKNVSKLLADVSVMGFFLAGVMGIWAISPEELKKNEFAKLVYERAQMATGDVFLLKSLLDNVKGQGSLTIGIAIAYRSAASLFEASYIIPMSLIDEDVTAEDATNATNQFFRNTIGLYKSLDIAYNTVIEE